MRSSGDFARFCREVPLARWLRRRAGDRNIDQIAAEIFPNFRKQSWFIVATLAAKGRRAIL
jgi:hypothetical protein